MIVFTNFFASAHDLLPFRLPKDRQMPYYKEDLALCNVC